MKHTPGRLLSALARLLVRGPDAPFILGDMEEAMQRDIARGVSGGRARLRFLVNAVASGLSLARRPVSGRGAAASGWWLDVKLGWRMLWKTPVLTVVAVLALAVGIPVGLAPVHVMDAFDAAPPVEEADRLMGLRYHWSGDVATTAFELDLWRRSLRSFEELAAVRPVERNFAVGSGVPVPVAAAEVTASAFSVLRVRPLLGRTLQRSDETPGAHPVVVLSHEAWQSWMDGRGDVIGSLVRIMGVTHTVVGVMPEGFLFPVRESLWLPLRDRPSSEPGQGTVLRVFGRLATGASDAAGETELAVVHAGTAAAFPEALEQARVEVVSLTSLLSDLPKGGLGAVPGMGPLSIVSTFRLIALIMLLVACANVGLLIFARTATRSQELVVRTALGASRARVVGQIVTEVLVLALVAAGAGLLLMDLLADRLLIAMWSADGARVPWWIDLGVNAKTVVRALGLAVFSAVAAALVPALRLTGERIRRNMSTAEAGGFGIRFGGVWSALIIVDVAAAVTAVGLAAVLNVHLQRAASGAEMVGLAAEEYLAVRIGLPDMRSPADVAPRGDELAAIHRRLIERLEAEPGVRALAIGDRLPRMDHDVRRLEIENGPGEVVDVAHVDPGFFAALDQPILSGRGFDSRDLEGNRTEVIVSAAFARELLRGQNPVGRRFRYLSFADNTPGPWLEIVGMVGDLGADLMQPTDAAAVYHAAAPGEMYPLHIAVRAGRDPASFTPRLRQLVAEVDPSLMVTLARPLPEVMPGGWSEMAGLLVGWTVFVAILLALAGTGVYAIMAFSVAQRTREIGIRAALGARTRDIAAAIGRRAAVQLCTGALIGMPLAGLLYFTLATGMGHNVAGAQAVDANAPLDALLVAVIPGILIVLVVGFVACAGPLRRALRIPPNLAIRDVG